jgi:hypothetical protein
MMPSKDELQQERDQIKKIMYHLDRSSINPMHKSEVATLLYGNGCRMISPDEIIIPKEEYNNLLGLRPVEIPDFYETMKCRVKQLEIENNGLRDTFNSVLSKFKKAEIDRDLNKTRYDELKSKSDDLKEFNCNLAIENQRLKDKLNLTEGKVDKILNDLYNKFSSEYTNGLRNGYYNRHFADLIIEYAKREGIEIPEE